MRLRIGKSCRMRCSLILTQVRISKSEILKQVQDEATHRQAVQDEATHRQAVQDEDIVNEQDEDAPHSNED
ncbi:MAG: hypothetical protein IJ756_00425 [Paludibacteraceae bacterium]|nr:hypothetical protein [Paludibacteraceae bacterium]